ncbi:hypothetical protein ACHQM5_021856 [Ranunculus cassubicifolius]
MISKSGELPSLFVCVSQIDSLCKPARYILWYNTQLQGSTVQVVIEESEYDGRSKKNIAKQYSRASSGCHSWSGSAVCNSNLYMIGGDRDSLDVTSQSPDEVFVCSATKISANNSAWRKYPVKLKAERHNPVAITIQNLVYIFGTVAHSSGSPNPWAEVLDTKSITIKPLNSQPLRSSICAGFILCSAVVNTDSQTKILLATSHHSYNGPSRLLFYLVEDGRWEDVTELHPNFFDAGPALSLRSAVIDGILYTYHYKNIYAYDLEKREWFDNPVTGLLEEAECYYEYDNNKGFVVDLGDKKLCVGFCTTFPLGGKNQKSKLLLHYAAFTPYIYRKPGQARALIGSQLHSKGYSVLEGMHFVDAMRMNWSSSNYKVQENKKISKPVNSKVDTTSGRKIEELSWRTKKFKHQVLVRGTTAYR